MCQHPYDRQKNQSIHNINAILAPKWKNTEHVMIEVGIKTGVKLSYGKHHTTYCKY